MTANVHERYVACVTFYFVKDRHSAVLGYVNNNKIPRPNTVGGIMWFAIVICETKTIQTNTQSVIHRPVLHRHACKVLSSESITN